MADLSPAAQSVLDAALKYSTQAWSEATHQRFNLGIAAALRAVARYCKRDTLLLLSLADELEGQSES